MLEIKDFSKVRRSNSRTIFGYFGVGFLVIEGSGREIENWVVGESGTHSPSGSQGGFSGNVKYPGVIRVFENYTLSKSVKYFWDKKLIF